MKKTALNVAIYARVSTLDKGQDPDTQLLQLRQYADARGFTVSEEFVDYASGKTEARPRFIEMMNSVRKRRFDIVLVWRYDRFARSTQALVNSLGEFRSLGVDFISFQENIDTTTPQGELIFNIMASLAQFESALISQRVKAGMHRAKTQGKRISRPSLPPHIQSQIRQLRKQNVSIKQIAKQLDISYGSAWNYSNKFKLASSS